MKEELTEKERLHIEEEMGNLRRQRTQEAFEARKQAEEWDKMIERYRKTAQTEDGLTLIEAMLYAQDVDRIELVKYMPGLIAEIRRLRGEKR